MGYEIPKEMILFQEDYRNEKHYSFKVTPVTDEYLKENVLPEMCIVVDSGCGGTEGFVFLNPVRIICNAQGVFVSVWVKKSPGIKAHEIFVCLPDGFDLCKVYQNIVPYWYKLYPHERKCEGIEYILPRDLDVLSAHADVRLKNIAKNWEVPWNPLSRVVDSIDAQK